MILFRNQRIIKIDNNSNFFHDHMIHIAITESVSSLFHLYCI